MTTLAALRNCRNATILALMAAQLCTAADARAQGALTNRLSDTEFWELFSTFSEEGGTFTTENYTSNEANVALVASMLIERGRTGGAYIGVGPEQNFTYVVALRPQLAFIVDIRRGAAIQHLMFKALFELSGTRAEFIGKLFARPSPNVQLSPTTSIHELWLSYLAATPEPTLQARNLDAIREQLMVSHKFPMSDADQESLARIYDAFVKTGPSIHYLTGLAAAANANRSANFASLTMAVDSAGMARSFLGSEESFALVRDMHSRNTIIPIVGDFGGPKALRAVAAFLKARGDINVNAFYVSNVEQYLFRPVNKTREFYGNVAALPLDTTSIFIRPGSAGSMPLAAPPFSSQTSTAALKAYVDSLSRVRSQRPPASALCNILRFLEAFNAGRVMASADAERCAA